MSEPKVEFDLNKLQDEDVRLMFDELRRWYEFREDVKTPSMQTFEGVLADDESINLYVPGVVVGYSGMAERPLGGVPSYWDPMLFHLGPVSSGRVGFTADLENSDGNYVRVLCNSDGPELKYRVTIMYRDA